MRTRRALFGRLTRLLLVATALTAWAGTISLLSAVHAPARQVLAPVGRVVIPGTEDVLALEQAAQTAETSAEARNPKNIVFTADSSVYAAVGEYSDCTGQAPLTHAAAAIDTCVGGLRYFIGHNPGVFSGLMNVGVGSLIGYYDGSGHLFRYEVVAERTWPRSAGVPPPAQAGEAAQFQTCVTADGSVDRILDAITI